MCVSTSTPVNTQVYIYYCVRIIIILFATECVRCVKTRGNKFSTGFSCFNFYFDFNTHST